MGSWDIIQFKSSGRFRTGVVVNNAQVKYPRRRSYRPGEHLNLDSDQRTSLTKTGPGSQRTISDYRAWKVEVPGASYFHVVGIRGNEKHVSQK